MEKVGSMLFCQQIKGIGHVQLVAATGVFRHGLQGVVVADFPNGSRAGILVEQGTQALQKGQVFRAGLIVFVELVCVRVFLAHTNGAFSNGVAGRIVPQFRIVETEVDGVQAEAVHAAVQPEFYV